MTYSPALLLTATGSAWLVFSFPSFSGWRFADGPGTEIGKKAWLFAKLEPGRARKRINATQEAPFYRALYILGWVKNVVHARKRTKLVWVMFQNRVRTLDIQPNRV